MARKHYTHQQKADWLAKFEKSSLSAASFCRKHQLNSQTFANWRRKAKPFDPPSFVEIEIPQKETTPLVRDTVELTFASGMKLRIITQTSAHS